MFMLQIFKILKLKKDKYKGRGDKMLSYKNQTHLKVCNASL